MLGLLGNVYRPPRRRGYKRRRSCLPFQSVLLYVLFILALLIQSAFVHASASSASVASVDTERKKSMHHHCIHEEKVDEFEATVNRDSIINPQQLHAPPDSQIQQQNWIVEGFLDTLGLSATTFKRSLQSTEESASAFLPIRIAFDLSKLSSDDGFMCVNEGDVVNVDDQSYSCTKDDVLTPVKKDFIVSVLLKGIKDYFENTLSVQRVIGNLIIGGITCSSGSTWACCSSSIPQSYRTDGVANADYVLHVTARPTTGATIAWALPCNIDQYGRPISGQANFGPGKLDPSTPSSRDEQIGTGIHEMTHALVFSRSRFYDFRQPLNGKLWGYSNVVSQVKGRGGITVSKIITPNVVKQVKQHFNCFNWVDAGLELENGDKGSADFSSHWEKRVVMNEYMSATSSYDPVYSVFTLALFEDSGWYQVSYKGAQILPWGYMEGCGVAQSICSEWNDRYACKDASQLACTSDYNSKGYCNVAKYSSSIPAGFQYFQDPTFGGRDTYADYCPFYRAYSNGDCRGIGRVATYADTDNYMEEVGLSSKCFMSSLSKRSSDTAATRSTCYRITGCSSTSLKLSIGGKDVECPLEGGEVTVSGYRGKLVCPVGTRLCQMLQDKCSGSGVLLSDGTCQCNPGYVGSDCSAIACPKASDQECGGDAHGTCDYTTGSCKCTGAYTGISCTDLVCPIVMGKNDTECSGQGTCNRAYGTCTCQNGYSGKACECVPGCTDASCGENGLCDCTTGACSCAKGYSGVNCASQTAPVVVELTEEGGPVTDIVTDKEYKFYKINLASSSYDVTFILEHVIADRVDVDLYGSFDDEYPTSLSSKSGLFKSDLSVGTRDEINLCGSLGVFPRGLNDTFRYCSRATSSYLLETPGYFYLSVLGYKGGSYTLKIETDKCKGVACSNHGACGINYAGVCTCDRYWSGDDCSVPKCGPDCQDLGTCGQSNAVTSAADSTGDSDDPITTSVTTGLSDSVSSAITASRPLRNTSECYGNGVCQVVTKADGKDVPTCVCDEAFSFKRPSATQALCKELVPSIAYIEHYTEPFTVSATLLDLQLSVNAWALYTVQVKDEWEILVANLEVTSTETDAMLFIRKEKLPSVFSPSSASSSSSSSYLQFMDSDGWTAGSMTRKIFLSRATSTLSSGLYYIGVFNSAYARANLAYTLSVNATADCSTPSSSSNDYNYGVCENGGQCNAKSSQVCTCPTGFGGKYCGLKAARASLSPSTAIKENSGSNATPLSYLAFSMENTGILEIGDWSYYSFEVNDVDTKLIQIKLLIENDLNTATPVLPLLLVRGPNDDGFPTLYSESQQDFAAIATHAAQQIVAIPVETACSYASNLKECYKVAVYNRQYSGSTLRYRLEVRLFGSTTATYPLQACGSTGDAVNCNGNGKCVLVTGSSSSSGAVPSCQCYIGWSGMRCNSPKSFALPQLWSAISNISLLCSVCSSAFSLSRGEIKMFRVPESLRENSGLRLQVKTTDSSSSVSATSGGVIPSVYVSEVLPRSIYDFSHISIANESAGSSSQVLSLPNASFTGQFWIVVYSDYPTSELVGVSAITAPSDNSRRRLEQKLQMLHSQHALRLLTSSSTSSSSSSSSTSSEAAGTFQLVAEVYELPDDVASGNLLTKKSFLREVVHWLFHTSIGVGVFIFLVVFMLLIFSYCLWRVCHAPENQDKQTLSHFGRNRIGENLGGGASQSTTLSGTTLTPIRATAPVHDTASPHQQQERDMELGVTAATTGKGTNSKKAQATRKR